MFGINGGELLVLLVILAFVVGPARLPEYAAQLGAFARAAKAHATAAKAQVESELGEQGTGLDWATLDPRQYDPRRIVRDALLEPLPASTRPRSAVNDSPPPADEPGMVHPWTRLDDAVAVAVPDEAGATDLARSDEPGPSETGLPSTAPLPGREELVDRDEGHQPSGE